MGARYASGVPALTFRELQFQRVAVECRSARGVPYSRWASVGVPAIPIQLLDCIGYLYPDRDRAALGKDYGGSGFIVGVPSSTNAGRAHTYLISNYHVAIKRGMSVLRLNTHNGGSTSLNLIR